MPSKAVAAPAADPLKKVSTTRQSGLARGGVAPVGEKRKPRSEPARRT